MQIRKLKFLDKITRGTFSDHVFYSAVHNITTNVKWELNLRPLRNAWSLATTTISSSQIDCQLNYRLFEAWSWARSTSGLGNQIQLLLSLYKLFAAYISMIVSSCHPKADKLLGILPSQPINYKHCNWATTKVLLRQGNSREKNVLLILNTLHSYDVIGSNCSSDQLECLYSPWATTVDAWRSCSPVDVILMLRNNWCCHTDVSFFFQSPPRVLGTACLVFERNETESIDKRSHLFNLKRRDLSLFLSIQLFHSFRFWISLHWEKD